jgi:hypothetical protein
MKTLVRNLTRGQPPNISFADLEDWQADERTIQQLCRQLNCTRAELPFAVTALKTQLEKVREQIGKRSTSPE